MRVKTYLKSCVAWVALLLIAGGAYAQTTVSGTVTGDGAPLEGATVIVEGTNIGTFTDENGAFSVSSSSTINTLIVKYVSYKDAIIEVAGRSEIDIDMEPDFAIDEVVVTGYGTAKTREITNAITSVKAEDFNGGNVNDPTQLIQGKVAGLTITRPGSDPNGGFNIRLRGVSTLGANAQPLVVIDGVIGAALETVDPNDIQSVDILKDGSAAAIYGSRASSGVIIITTKRGLRGESKFEYNGYAAAEMIARSVPNATADEFRQYRPAADRGASTNWLDEVTRPGLSHVHNLSLSGGFGGTSYRVSLNYRDIQGVSIASGFKRINGRLNVTQKALNDKLTVSLNVTATDKKANFGFNEAFRYATTYNPTAPVFADETSPLFDRYGGYYQEENFDYFNPLAILEQNVNEGVQQDLLVSIRGEYEIVDGLSISGFYARQRESDLNGQYYDKQSYFRGINRNGLASRFAEDRLNELFESTLRFEQDFGSSNLELLGGYSYQDNSVQNVFAEAGDFLSDATSYNALSFAQDFPNARANVNSFAENFKVIGFFGRARLNVDDTYFLMASVRYEGSTRFGEDNKWGIFPAASAGVTISNLVDIPKVDNLKLRVGYGVTGALPPESYLSLQRFTRQGSFFYNGEFVPAFGPDRNPNPGLRWETKAEINAGLDFALFDYRLTGSLDFYDRNTSDLIFNVPVPVPPNLADRTWANVEDFTLRNTGFEASVGYLFESGNNFSWEPRVNFATFNTRLDSVPADQIENPDFVFFRDGGQFQDFLWSPGAPGLNNDPAAVVLKGEQLGKFYGFEYEGIDENGGFVYKDQNGDGVIDGEDEVPFGRGLPTFSLGIANTFKFGNFDFTFFLRGDFGHQLANMYRVFYEPLGSRPIENLVITDNFDENLTATPLFSSRFVENADFITLDNATLGYTFDLGSNSQFSKIRLYLAGQNLFILTNYSGVDPSVRYADPGSADNGGRPGREFNPDPLAPGIARRNTYFLTRTITFGANLAF
jgi:TonB-linked SusC/RagA family outer membrane protein